MLTLGIANEAEMNPQSERVLKFFDEYVFGFMRSDIDATIRGKANFLAALGLVSYTEVLGGLVTSNLAKRGQSGANFRAFLPYLGKDYETFETRDIDIYDTVRCGLVHQYFIKGDSTIWMQASAPRGIVASPQGPTYFFVNIYRDHLFAGAARYRNDLLDGSNESLVKNFENSVRDIGITI